MQPSGLSSFPHGAPQQYPHVAQFQPAVSYSVTTPNRDDLLHNLQHISTTTKSTIRLLESQGTEKQDQEKQAQMKKVAQATIDRAQSQLKQISPSLNALPNDLEILHARNDATGGIQWLQEIVRLLPTHVAPTPGPTSSNEKGVNELTLQKIAQIARSAAEEMDKIQTFQPSNPWTAHTDKMEMCHQWADTVQAALNEVPTEDQESQQAKASIEATVQQVKDRLPPRLDFKKGTGLHNIAELKALLRSNPIELDEALMKSPNLIGLIKALKQELLAAPVRQTPCPDTQYLFKRAFLLHMLDAHNTLFSKSKALKKMGQRPDCSLEFQKNCVAHMRKEAKEALRMISSEIRDLERYKLLPNEMMTNITNASNILRTCIKKLKEPLAQLDNARSAVQRLEVDLERSEIGIKNRKEELQDLKQELKVNPLFPEAQEQVDKAFFHLLGDVYARVSARILQEKIKRDGSTPETRKNLSQQAIEAAREELDIINSEIFDFQDQRLISEEAIRNITRYRDAVEIGIGKLQQDLDAPLNDNATQTTDHGEEWIIDPAWIQGSEKGS